MNAMRFPQTSQSPVHGPTADVLPFGSAVVPGGVRFRVWAPKAQRVEVVRAPTNPTPCAEAWPLASEGDGVFSATIPGIRAGFRYRYRLDGDAAFPDPWSWSQPEGVHGPSEVVAAGAYAWTDDGWLGVDLDRLVLYELHVGTFTPEGTFDGVRGQLAALQRLGVTALELMPIADFPGHHNWGYDGVDLFAPSRNYGGVAGLKRLVDAAHRRGLGVFLDVVYNHLGPDGNYLRAYSDDYFTDLYHTPWGEAVNYDGPGSPRVRELVVENAAYWLREYHLDGLRLDATHAIFDRSPRHLLAELAEKGRAAVGLNRQVGIIAEDSRNDVRFLRPVAEGGLGLDGVWADDFHHTVHTALTGEREGYYADYDGVASAIARTITGGWLYQGQWSSFRQGPRGTPTTDEPARAFIYCLQNHDQIGNRAGGERLNHLVTPAAFAAASTLLLLCPETPLLFMGQEFAASAPFLYFTDHVPELGRLVTEGRRQEFAHFSAFADPERRAHIPDPQAADTFRRSKLDFAERKTHAGTHRLYRELLRLRHADPVLCRPRRDWTDAAALTDRALVLRRWLPPDSTGDPPPEAVPSHGPDRRLVLVNFGPALDLAVEDHPSLTWLTEGRWQLLLSSAARRFHGDGRALRRRRTRRGLRLTLPAETALVLGASSEG